MLKAQFYSQVLMEAKRRVIEDGCPRLISLIGDQYRITVKEDWTDNTIAGIIWDRPLAYVWPTGVEKIY